MIDSPNTRAAQVHELIRTVLGEEPLEVTHQDFGHQSLTFDVTLPGRSVIVRTHSHLPAFRKTAHNLAVLADLGLPVSRLLAADLTGERFPFAYLLLEKIPGRDLRDELSTMTKPQMTRLAAQIVGFQQQVRMLPAGTGFGYAPLGETGPFATLWDFLHEGEAATAGVMEPRLKLLLQAQEDELRQAVPVCFLDDLTTKNVLVENGILQGLIDFDFVCCGDPLFWLGLTATVIVLDLGTGELFYAEELCRLLSLTPKQRQRVALYAAWISLGFLHKAVGKPPEVWQTRLTNTRERWLAEASSIPTGPKS